MRIKNVDRVEYVKNKGRRSLKKGNGERRKCKKNEIWR